MCWGAPLRAADTRLWRALLVGGFSSPFPPSTAARVKRGLPFGGILVSVLPWDPRAPCARWGHPSGSGGPPRRGLPRQSSWLSPPSPSLRAVVSRFWVGIPPLSSPPSWPLELSAGGHLGRALSVIASSAVCPSAFLLLGASFTPSVRWAVPSPLCPPALGARGWSGGALSIIASSAIRPVSPSLLGVSSPPAFCRSEPGDGSGLTLPWAPSNAAWAAMGV